MRMKKRSAATILVSSLVGLLAGVWIVTTVLKLFA